MNLTDRLAYILAVVSFAPLSAIAVPPQEPPQAPSRTQTVFSHPLPSLQGDHLSVTVVRVSYGPGEFSAPHSHPCPVIGYVLQGSVRMQVQEPSASPGPVTVYHAGDSFYEAPNGRHLISANASPTQPAIFTATFVCDHPAPLTTPVLHKESHP